MDLGLQEKVVLVTGASRGIGKAIAETFAREGSAVILNARNPQELERVVSSIRRQNDRVSGIAADLSQASEVERLAEKALARFGAIHVLVNNVGGTNKIATFEEATDEDWINAFHLNVLSTVRLIRAIVPVMQKQHWGRIINIASESGTQPYPVMPHYATTKAAIINLSKSLSKAYASAGILVNSVSPAMTWTPLVEELFTAQASEQGVTLEEYRQTFIRELRIALDRPARPEEVATAVVYLASEAASFITGTNMRVDGGTIASI
ncbi:putative oxidoreductase YvrD [Reticulibacter mediterranei]|uniref:Putative oxidoreductase YvrD n=1 Tax=Reticulibacter mediterranei TaxID=2778369 RepID=A0A8J3J1I0_9CHLR|nr:glucose 1-dehydrogenase [Reticulibacter mediterranei]GHO99066.1 putative oxidoreductase YvrD [Reticulibacter mediterranei]